MIHRVTESSLTQEMRLNCQVKVVMTPDMKFEALLVSRDLQILRRTAETMDDLSIDVDICGSPSRAIDLLARRNVDLLILDYDEGNGTAEIAKTFRSVGCLRMTIAALVDGSISGKQIIEAGAQVLIQKPLSDKDRKS